MAKQYRVLAIEKDNAKHVVVYSRESGMSTIIDIQMDNEYEVDITKNVSKHSFFWSIESMATCFYSKTTLTLSEYRNYCNMHGKSEVLTKKPYLYDYIMSKVTEAVGTEVGLLLRNIDVGKISRADFEILYAVCS